LISSPSTLNRRHRARSCCRESLWRDAKALRKTQVSNRLRIWLLDSGSLTRRLRGLCPGQFRVKIITQGWAAPLINEAHHLNIAAQRRIFRREVVLYCGERPMVYARTVIPARTLRGRLSHLANLGEKPLGEVLFTDPHILRRDLEIARLQPGELLFESARGALLDRQENAINTIWARRSTFAYHDKQLLVSEIFLPNQEFGYDLTASGTSSSGVRQTA
jgi:chorismate--pyruvate lyase